MSPTPRSGTAHATGTGAAAPGYAATKDDQLKRLRRIEGQVRGLQRMVESDAYCIDVLTQVSAATRALESFALGLLEEHLAHCVSEAIAAGGNAEVTSAANRQPPPFRQPGKSSLPAKKRLSPLETAAEP